MILLLRALLFNALFFGLSPFIALFGAGVRKVAPHNVVRVPQLWARLTVAAARQICGIHVVVTGAEYMPRGGPALLACQHQSAFDTIVWLTLVPLPSYVVKHELTRIPLFGPLLEPAGMIPVDREGGSTTMRGLIQATIAAKAAGRQIVIFPEGTRVAPGERVALKPGIAAIAARLDLPVIPVATDSGRFWGRRSFRKKPGLLHIALGPPIPPSTRRAEMLATIEAFWRQQESSGFGPVDKPVGKEFTETPRTLNALSQLS